MIPLGFVELEHEYHVVELSTMPSNLFEWMEENFGPSGQRWFIRHNKIYFKHERDYFWFELKT